MNYDKIVIYEGELWKILEKTDEWITIFRTSKKNRVTVVIPSSDVIEQKIFVVKTKSE